MTPKAQQIAIAEACGLDCGCVKRSLERFKGRDGYPDAIFQLGKIPDYLNDLNAMHEAEKVLTFHQWSEYVDHIIDDWPAPMFKAEYRGYEVCHATAAQRAEAFLRCIDKWVD